MPASRARRECVALDATDHRGGDRLLPRRTRSISSWSAPRRRWSPARRRSARPPASRPSGRAKGRAAGRLQGLHQGPVQGQRHPDRRLSRASTSAAAANAYVREQGAPIVVKADGLAAGKGVIVAETMDEAEAAIDACSTARSARPAWEVVIEEFLIGEEASFFALSDGETRPAAGHRRRTTSASATATRAPIPAAWAPIRRRRS